MRIFVAGPPGPWAAGLRAAGAAGGSWPRASPGGRPPGVGGPVKTEDDPFDPDPPAQLRRTLDAIRHLESAVLGAEASK
jgi:hypothetical protein